MYLAYTDYFASGEGRRIELHTGRNAEDALSHVVDYFRPATQVFPLADVLAADRDEGQAPRGEGSLLAVAHRQLATMAPTAYSELKEGRATVDLHFTYRFSRS